MKHWYVVHTQTGLEDKVKTSLESKISSSGLGEQIVKVIIPTEQVSEIRSGKKKISQRKFFPGYLLVEMDLNEQAYFLIKAIPGVTGFIGPGKKPEQVRVTDGPFVNFNGTVEEIHPEKGKVKVSVSIFGRATPVELEYWQVEKV